MRNLVHDFCIFPKIWYKFCCFHPGSGIFYQSQYLKQNGLLLNERLHGSKELVFLSYTVLCSHSSVSQNNAKLSP